VKYVDIGYTVCLATLFLYSLSLLARRRRLTRAAALAAAEPDRPHPTTADPTPGRPR
jgi:hypothetical protein